MLRGFSKQNDHHFFIHFFAGARFGNPPKRSPPPNNKPLICLVKEMRPLLAKLLRGMFQPSSVWIDNVCRFPGIWNRTSMYIYIYIHNKYVHFGVPIPVTCEQFPGRLSMAGTPSQLLACISKGLPA